MYTSHGETVLDLDGDNHLHEAAVATGRSYLSGFDATRTDGLDQTDQQVSLITLRWPRADLSPSGHAGGLLGANRLPISDDACVIVAIQPGSLAEPNQAFADHARALCTVAEAARLTLVLRISATGAPGNGDRFLYYATKTEVTRAATEDTTAPTQQVPHIDLLLFQARREPV
ncbi:hypothetical protein [Micromonospora sp. NPDC023737]|uniref:hypothetical protein n=1 Tax=unclassified Micromonospora TaxID=2617518 RepID=UPI0033FE8D65